MRYFLAAVLVAALQLHSASAISAPVVPTFGHPFVVAHPQSGRPLVGRNLFDFNSPLSTSVLVARALRSGYYRLPNRYFYQPFPFALTCSPAPCRTPNVQASEGGQPVNETPITRDPHDLSHLLSGGNDYNCSNTQGFYASSDGGTHWNHTCFGNVSGTVGVGDPDVGYDTKGTAYIAGIDEYSGTQAVIALESSTDNGKSWSQPAIAVSGISPYDFTDKDWLQIDQSPTSKFKDSLYISTTGFDSSSNSSINVAHSRDGGKTFMNVMVDAVNVPTVDQFTDIAIASDGTVYVSWMRCPGNGPNGNCGQTKATMFVARSTDGGVHWTKPMKIGDAELAEDSCGAFYGCLPNTNERVSDIPVIDVDRSSGTYHNRLYAAYYNYDGTALRVREVWSSDEGAHWSAPVEVSNARNDEFFPWLSTSHNGTVGVTWLDRRRDPANLSYDAFAATSTDGGATIGTNVRISTASSNPDNDGFSGSFMGDYTGNIWDAQTLYQSWTDTRTDTGQDEIGGLRI